MMNSSHGWIKLYRCLLDDAVCQKSAYFHLWGTLLLIAAHTDREFIFNNQIHTLKPDQLITGRKKLSKLTGIPHTTVERILKCLESGHKIKQKITKNYRVISIVKWEDYPSQTNNESHRPRCRTVTGETIRDNVIDKPYCDTDWVQRDGGLLKIYFLTV